MNSRLEGSQARTAVATALEAAALVDGGRGSVGGTGSCDMTRVRPSFPFLTAEIRESSFQAVLPVCVCARACVCACVRVRVCFNR